MANDRPAPSPLRWLIVSSIGVALIVFAWQWISGGIAQQHIVEAGTPMTWVQTRTNPTATERGDGTYEYSCPGGSRRGTRITGGTSFTAPAFPNPEQLPEFVACFERREGSAEVVETRIALPSPEHGLWALGAGVVAYFVGVGFVLSRRALDASAARD